jgi:hypothetical protein
MIRLYLLFIFTGISLLAAGQATTIKNLQPEWMTYSDGTYQPATALEAIGNTIYFDVEPLKHADAKLQIESGNPFFIFMNGNLIREGEKKEVFDLDSLSAAGSSLFFAIHQQNINPRELKTTIIAATSARQQADLSIPVKPNPFFRDFAVLSGLIIITLFVAIINLNPKLASDYFSVVKIFSLREADDAQSNARLTSSSNIQFYVASSLLLGFYLILILKHLPDEYSLPLHFEASSFWQLVGQWLRLSMIILMVFGIKIFLIYMLTRLFDMKGLARVHFFNWIRLLLIVVGAFTVIVFIYYISRGQGSGFFAVLLMLAMVALAAWIVVVFMKLNGKTEHSMFHLFSYICATEIIPMVIIIKVLFQ